MFKAVITFTTPNGSGKAFFCGTLTEMSARVLAMKARGYDNILSELVDAAPMAAGTEDVEAA